MFSVINCAFLENTVGGTTLAKTPPRKKLLWAKKNALAKSIGTDEKMFYKNTINTIIRTLIISDFFLFFALGLLSPIFAVFVLKNIENEVGVVGFAAACYWIMRVIMVTPLSRLMDKMKGETDEYTFVALGTFLMATIPLFYIISSKAWHVYLLQALNGMAASMAVPAWRILFTNHADRGIVGFEWSLEDVGVGIATASSAIIGALIVEKFGFNTLFCMIFLFGTLSALILATLHKDKKMALKKLIRRTTNETPLKIDSFK